MASSGERLSRAKCLSYAITYQVPLSSRSWARTLHAHSSTSRSATLVAIIVEKRECAMRSRETRQINLGDLLY
jgi:hypothetical protein